MKAKRSCFFVLVLAVLFSSHSLEGLLVDHVSITSQNYGFFDPTGQGFYHIPTVPVITADVSVGSWDYSFSGTVSLTQCFLQNDNSSGGVASGDFAGGATLSISGDLWAKSDPGTLLVDDGLILEALMQSEDWVLHEASYLGIDGSTLFSPTGGHLTGGTLTLGDFSADFSYQFVSPSPDFFDQTYSGLVSTIQITSIPEPATMILLAMGGLFVRTARRK